MVQEQLNAPVDINLYDIAQADMSKNNGFSTN